MDTKAKDSENGLYFDIESKLKIAKFEIKIIKYRSELVKLKSLINQTVIKDLIVYVNYNFFPYSIDIFQSDTKFFNIFLGFLAKPMMKISREIMDPIFWHILNVICNGNEKLNEYI